jgi:hypothetical protein
MGPINEQALSDLHIIVNLVKYFGNEGFGSSTPGPDFYWCLRDFYHDISE